jgi:hypothetical protein
VCVAIGNCKIGELNKRKMRVLGLQHKDVQAFIQKEDNDCKRWNITHRESEYEYKSRFKVLKE